MVRNRRPSPSAALQPCRHRPPDRRPILVRFNSRLLADPCHIVGVQPCQARWPVAPQHPQHVAAPLQLARQVGAVLFRISRIVVPEQPRSRAPWRCQLVAPRRNQRHIQPMPRRLIHNLRHAVKEVFVRPFHIPVCKWKKPRRRRLPHPAKLGQNHGLDHREPLPCPRLQIVRALVSRKFLYQLPRRISQPKKRTPVRPGQHVSIFMDHNPGQRLALAAAGSARLAS